MKLLALAPSIALSLAAIIVAAPAAAQGADLCVFAQPITATGAFPVDTSLAATDGPANGCGENGQIHNDVWFRWTSTVSGTVQMDTCAAATFDTTVAVYPDESCATAAPIVCNDDQCALRSRVAFTAVAGVDYLVRVGGWNDVARGTATLTISSVTGVSNDTCANPAPITGFGVFPMDTTQAMTEGVADGCGSGGQIYRDVWYLWTATVDGSTEVNTCQASFDTTIAVYDGAACPTAAPIACNDDACSIQTRVTFPAIAGNTYLLRMGGFNESAGGVFDATISAGSGVNCSSPPAGPDVIIGDLPAIQSYGGAAEMSAFALATTACNVGDATMNWNGSNRFHPVIGQNLYRIEDGAIRQLGMSWLKHGFASATGSLCCTCINPGSNQIMGIGCSDPYGATINGAQSGLGPRSEVNPWTGLFAYPFGTQGQTGDVIYKRLQVPTQDVDPALHPAARYVVEGQYVTPDDAQAGNQNNNCSWADAQPSGPVAGGLGLAISGATSVGEPAIFAWRADDPEVQISTVAAAGDGVIHVGSRAHDNGDGTWRYEYAVHNETSARAARSLRVPVAAGSTVTGAAFHDVDYHSGEPYDGTDWAFTVAAGAMEWATPGHAVNPDGNALRWGTLYGFTVTASAPPVAGAVDLELFVPGLENLLTAAAIVPGVPVLGERYCSPAIVNSSGAPAVLRALGSAVVADDDLTLEASSMPLHTSGYMLASLDEGFAAQPGGSQGNLCLGGTIARFRSQVMSSGAEGRFSIPVDLSSIPITPPTAVLPGETWRFQCWFRDQLVFGITSSNFTDAVRVTFE